VVALVLKSWLRLPIAATGTGRFLKINFAALILDVFVLLLTVKARDSTLRGSEARMVIGAMVIIDVIFIEIVNQFEPNKHASNWAIMP